MLRQSAICSDVGTVAKSCSTPVKFPVIKGPHKKYRIPEELACFKEITYEKRLHKNYYGGD